MAIGQTELEEKLDKVVNGNTRIRKIKCSCLDADIKAAIMSSNLDINIKQDLKKLSEEIEMMIGMIGKRDIKDMTP